MITKKRIYVIRNTKSGMFVCPDNSTPKYFWFFKNEGHSFNSWREAYNFKRRVEKNCEKRQIKFNLIIEKIEMEVEEKETRTETSNSIIFKKAQLDTVDGQWDFNYERKFEFKEGYLFVTDIDCDNVLLVVPKEKINRLINNEYYKRN